MFAQWQMCKLQMGNDLVKVKDGSRQKACVKIGQKLSQRFFVKGWIISKLRENVKMQKVNCF